MRPAWGRGTACHWAPGVFDLDDDGVAIVCGDLLANEENVRLAAMTLPHAGNPDRGALRVSPSAVEPARRLAHRESRIHDQV